MKDKDLKLGMSKEQAKGFSSKLRVALIGGNIMEVEKVCLSVMGQFMPQSLSAFPVTSLPQETASVPQPQAKPEHEKSDKLYATIATNIWRIKNQLLAEDNSNGDDEQYKDELDGRAIGKIVRYINSLDAALKNGGIDVEGNFIGKPHREGSAVKVVSYEDRQDLKRDEYVEVLMPRVLITDDQGQTRMIQPAEVVVGRPKISPAESISEN